MLFIYKLKWFKDLWNGGREKGDEIIKIKCCYNKIQKSIMYDCM